ncbi:MAG: hypothetical protein ACRDA3_15590 [Peptostreptococcaceae bacterium]
MKKLNQKLNIHSLRCKSIEDEDFETLLEEDLIDIENFLDSYVVNKVDEEKIDSTIEILKQHMPNQEVMVVKESNSLFNTIRENINLVKIQVGMMNKLYFIASLVLVLIGTISTIQLNLSIYLSASIIAPMPILLGIFEIIKGREENVWELELSYKYSLREIILSRLIIINLVSIVTSIALSFTLNSAYSSINLLNMISIWLIPIFIMGSISLIITSLYRSINSIALCISIWILGVMGISMYENIGDITSINTFIVLGLSSLILVISMKFFYKKSISSIDYKILDF